MSAFFRFTARVIALLLTTTAIGVGLAGTATAADTGALGGTVRTQDGGDVAGVIALHQWVDTGFVEAATQDLDGRSPTRYDFTDLPSGAYYVSFEDIAGTYMTGFGGGATKAPDSVDDLGVVQVGETAAPSDINLKPAATKQPVSGAIVNQSGAGINDVYVVATLVTPSGGRKYADDDATNAQGQFALELRPGSYVLDIEDIHQRHANTTKDVTITAGQSTIPPIALTPLQTWTFSGTVKDVFGNEVPGARVQLYSLKGVANDWWDYDPGPVATTDANGGYQFTELKNGEYYALGGSAYRYHAAILGGGADPTDGTSFRANQNRTLTDLHLEAATGLRGSVTSTFGAAKDVDVELKRWNDATDSFEPESEVPTDAAGRYQFDDVRAGTYTLRFDTTGAPGQLRSAWLGGSEPAGSSGDGVFTVGDTPTERVDNVTLAVRQLATGTLTNDTGDPLPGGTVAAYAYDGEADVWTLYKSVDTTAGGAFAVPVPASRTVTFRFSYTGYSPRFFDGSTSLPNTPTGQNSRETGADGDLALGVHELGAPIQLATGKVTSGSSSLAGATVTSYEWAGTGWVEFARTTTASNGTYAVSVPGNRLVSFRFTKDRYVTRYYGGGTRLPGTPPNAGTLATGLTGGLALATQSLTAVPVPKMASSTRAKLAKSRIKKGKSTTVTITVRASGMSGPTGVVQVFDGRKRIKSVTLTSTRRGVVKATLRKPSKGTHKIYATYAGSDRVVASTSPKVTLKVTKK